MYDCAYAYYAVPVMTAKCKLITLSHVTVLVVCTCSQLICQEKSRKKEEKGKEAAAMCIRLVFMMECKESK